MIESIIRWSIGNRFFVLLATLILIGLGLFSLKNTPVDAIPDLSDVQVIIKTNYPGQAPQVDVPSDDSNVIRTRCRYGQGLFIFWRFFCLCDL